jgi:hypothetical protein
MSDDDLAEDFATDNPTRDLNWSLYAISDSLAFDRDASFLCFKLKTVIKLRGTKDFDAQTFGVALFECFRRPDMEREIVDLRANEKQIAVVRAESRETGSDPSDSVAAKIPEVVRQGLDEFGLCLDIVPSANLSVDCSTTSLPGTCTDRVPS